MRKRKKKRNPVMKRRATMKEKGRQIMADQRVDYRGEAIDKNGVKPKRGLWLVHPERYRCYGRVLRLRRNGVVLICTNGRPMHHDGRQIYEGGYEYHKDMPPENDKWMFHVDLHWASAPPEGWAVIPTKGEQL